MKLGDEFILLGKWESSLAISKFLRKYNTPDERKALQSKAWSEKTLFI